MNHEPVDPTRVATSCRPNPAAWRSFLRDRDVAFGVALDHGDRAVVTVHAEKILHAGQVSGHDDVALAGLKRLECGGARGKQAIGDFEPSR